ncbi:U3 small nucleolar RNA-associated protein 14 like protein A, partial [Eufriesea mexicana]
RVKKAERSEPTLQVSEFHLVKSGISDQDAVQVHDLAKALGKKGHHFQITKNLRAIKKNVHILPKPLEKPAADKIKRIVAFKNTQEELKKWNAVITKNRTAESLRFPLHQVPMHLEPSSKFVKRFRLQSDLEKELAALEPQKENIEQKSDEFSLTLKEIIMKRKEAARIRAQQSYKEAKAHRQNKIKSKKFHRVQRKEKIKLQLKEFEELQKTNPEAALEKLEQLDKTRAEERMSLRHKNTGKWAKSKQIRAKYDKETQQELAQQLSISRDLTQKLRKQSESEEEDESDSRHEQLLVNDKGNSWTENTKTKSEIDEFVENYHKKNTDDKVDSFENKKKVPVIVNSNKHIISADSVNSNSKDNNITSNVQSFEIMNHKQNLPTTKFNIEDTKNNTYNKITQETMLDNNTIFNKKIKLPKTRVNIITATSNWNVESIENINVINSLISNTSNSEKINKIFDSMEEKVGNQIKSKFEHISKNYNKVKIKKRRKCKRSKFEKDNFDGLEIQVKRQKPILDLGLNEGIENNLDLNTELEKAKYMVHDNIVPIHKLNTSKVEIDPNKYINVKPKHLNTYLPNDITNGDDVLDNSENEEEMCNIVSEAFADDDVIEDFKKEKEEEVKKYQPKDIDLSLPGWGSWGGKNIQISKRKKKRFILKVPKDLPRKDENKGDVIIFEEDNPKIREHQVNEVPYPFSSVKDYESSIRMPIGRNFIPENAHRKLIEPNIKTCMGKIIEPMNEDILVKKGKEEHKKFIPKKINKIIKKRKIKKVIK